MIVQKILNKKDRAPSNYVGRIRSNLNFEVILKGKRQKNAKLQKSAKSFLAKILVTPVYRVVRKNH